MSSTVTTEVYGVRNMLGSPLIQNPSFLQIFEELEAEYMQITNETNNTGNAWQVSNYTLTTTADVYDYEISKVTAPDFYKALNVTTIPENSAQPQYLLEFTEIEHIPEDWQWLSTGKGQYMTSSHDSQIIAFYRTIDTGTEELHVQIRPTPASTQTYNILYQQADWWTQLNTSLATTLPHSSQKFYVRALVAKNLLLKGYVMWSNDPLYNVNKGKLVLEGLNQKLARYEPVYKEYIDSLDNPTVTYIESWADGLPFE